MDTVKYILAMPESVEGVGDIYQIKIKDYDIFLEISKYLYISKQHMESQLGDQFNDDIKLLDFLILITDDKLKLQHDLEKLFSLVFKEEVVFVANDKDYGFIIDENKIINRNNYEEIREIIMKQNLLFEPKIFKDPLVQKWAEKVIKARSKNAIKINIEDMITTVSIKTGKSYDLIANQSLYQLYADFKRISKDKDYDTSVLFKTVSPDININYFAENINMFENPYEKIFVSKEKVNNLDKVMK